MALQIYDANGNKVTTGVATSGDATYRAGGAIAGANVAASCTDLILLKGSASKVIRVRRVALSGWITTAINWPVYLKKHTVANTGGSLATDPDVVALDSNSPAAAGAVKVYTAVPTIDSSAKFVAGGNLSVAAATGQAVPVIWEFGVGGRMPLVIRGAAQEVAVNFNGANPTLTGLVLSWEIEWDESDA